VLSFILKVAAGGLPSSLGVGRDHASKASYRLVAESFVRPAIFVGLQSQSRHHCPSRDKVAVAIYGPSIGVCDTDLVAVALSEMNAPAFVMPAVCAFGSSRWFRCRTALEGCAGTLRQWFEKLVGLAVDIEVAPWSGSRCRALLDDAFDCESVIAVVVFKLRCVCRIR